MIHRLRSAKGSFVRSPKGAFEAAGAVVIPAGTLDYNTVATGGEFFLQFGFPDPQECTTGIEGFGLSTWTSDVSWALTFPSDINALINATWTGATSGATWRPADSGLVFTCGNATHQAWTAGTPVDIGSNRFRYPLTLDFTLNAGQVTRALVVSNTSTFPGVERPMLSFQQGIGPALEQVTFA